MVPGESCALVRYRALVTMAFLCEQCNRRSVAAVPGSAPLSDEEVHEMFLRQIEPQEPAAQDK